MKPITSGALTALLALLITACSAPGPDQPQPGIATEGTGAQPPSSWIAGQIDAAMDHARRELATRNIEVGNVHVGGRSEAPATRPKAEITPQGDLLIGGKTVVATPEQHALLLAYRQEIIAIAQAGMDIGTQGADLGIHAAKQALANAFSGQDAAATEAAIKPQADAIKASALKLCQRMPALLAAQQKLAAVMPAFQPYANMRQRDVDDCGKDLATARGPATTARTHP